MATLTDVAKFHIERLFNGAIDVDWLLSDPGKAQKVAESFVFHGPAYHGVSQKDIAETGHRLIDSASFFQNIVDALVNDSGQPFTLAIAGFGSGKSHIALTLSQLLESTNSSISSKIVGNIALADEKIADKLRKQLPLVSGKTLVITLNGMNNFDLGSEIISQAKIKLQARNLSIEPLEGLRQRFAHAINILKSLDVSLLAPLLTELNVSGKEIIFEKLDSFDELTYAKVHEFLQSLGIPLRAIGDETAKDVLNLLVSEYIGEGKPYSKMLLLFDEFGRYLEFATTKSQIAGNGALQQLYEGIQENSSKLAFVGFIQYELKAYEQRLPNEFKNDIRRFVTRFQSSEKLYLSINLETLIASLLEKKKTACDVEHARKSFLQIQHWYPTAKNHSLWNTEDMFLRVIGQGCWPLSPLAIWLLFHLSAGGQYLQQRSALSLLKTAIENNANFQLTDTCPTLPPVKIWTEELQNEFVDVEEQSGRNAIVQSYLSVLDKHSQHLSKIDILILRSIVLISITHLKSEGKSDTLSAISVFSGIAEEDVVPVVKNLEEELNIISWDETFHQFDIAGDSVSKSQFIRYLRHKIDVEYDSKQQEQLFIQKASIASDYLANIECDFANENKIYSSEWIFDRRYTYWSIFPRIVETEIQQYIDSVKFCPVDFPRGVIFYCYVSENEEIENIKLQAQKILNSCARKNGTVHVPIILALIHDSTEIGKIMSEIDIISKFTSQERELYGKIASIHCERRQEAFKEEVKKALLQRNFITTFPADVLPTRLAQIGNFIFEKIFSKILPFPFDNYRSNRTNAAQDCADFTRSLLLDDFLYDRVQSMPQRQQNRANTVLKETWRIFNKDGTIAVQPGHPNARAIVTEWDKLLHGDQEGLNIERALEIACSAPFGANIASAGLLFSVYYQARKNIVTIEENGQHTDWQTIGNRIFDGNVLALKTIASVTVFKIENNDSEWEQLLNDWGNAGSYVQRTEFAEQADDLEKRLQIPRVLRWKAQELKALALEARKKIDEADEREEKALNIIDRASQNDDVFNLSYGASLLSNCGKTKMDDPLWRPEDYTYLATHVTNAKQIIIQNFTEWLRGQRPNSRTQAGLTEFRDRLIVKMGRNLKTLGLSEQNTKIEQYYERISKSFEAIAECQQALGSVEAWIANNSSVPKDATLAQLKSICESIIAQAELLKRPQSAMKRLQQNTLLDEVAVKMQSLKELHAKIKTREKKIENDAKKLLESTLLPENAGDLQSSALELERLYFGSNVDMQDFRNMRNAAEFYIDCLQNLQNLNMSVIDFTTQSQSLREQFLSKFSAAELPWDLENAFNVLLKVCSQYRQQAASAWLCNIQTCVGKISTMTTEQGNDLLSSLNTPPPYVDVNANQEALNAAKSEIEHFLDSKEIEWLLARFKKMSKDAKKEFLQALKKEL